MDSCDVRLTAYKNGRSFQDCREVARSLVPGMLDMVRQKGRIHWDDIMGLSEFDAVVYKLCLKYLRESGCHIGNHRNRYVSYDA